MSQGPRSSWEHTDRGIIGANGDLVCDAPDPMDCTHLECNVGKPKLRRIPVDRKAIRQENRRAIIRLFPHELRQLFQLPEGYEVEHVFSSYDPMSVQVVVSSPELDKQPHDTYLPSLGGSLSRLHMVDAEGVVWTRWEWQPE